MNDSVSRATCTCTYVCTCSWSSYITLVCVYLSSFVIRLFSCSVLLICFFNNASSVLLALTSCFILNKTLSEFSDCSSLVLISFFSCDTCDCDVCRRLFNESLSCRVRVKWCWRSRRAWSASSRFFSSRFISDFNFEASLWDFSYLPCSWLLESEASDTWDWRVSIAVRLDVV